MNEKIFSSEFSGDSNDNLKPLPPLIKEALEKFRKKQAGDVEKSESSQKAREPHIDADMAQWHQNFRVIEEMFFELVRDELEKKDASESEIKRLEDGYKEYTECWDKAFVEKGEELSLVRDVYPRLSSGNLWFKYSQMLAEKHLGIERN